MRAPFDRHRFVKRMLGVGFTEQQANALADGYAQVDRHLRGEVHSDDVEAEAESRPRRDRTGDRGDAARNRGNAARNRGSTP